MGIPNPKATARKFVHVVQGAPGQKLRARLVHKNLRTGTFDPCIPTRRIPKHHGVLHAGTAPLLHAQSKPGRRGFSTIPPLAHKESNLPRRVFGQVNHKSNIEAEGP